LHAPNKGDGVFDWADSEIAVSNQIKMTDANGAQYLAAHFMT